MKDKRNSLAGILQFLKNPDSFLREPSFWTLVGAEAIAGWIALRQHWKPMSLVWLFWGQTVVMIVFNYFRIRYARVFTFGSYSCSSNGKPILNTREGLPAHAGIVAGLSALFLAVMLPFLFFASSSLRQDVIWLAGAVGVMLVHSLFEFIYDRIGKPQCEHIGNLAAMPLLRSLLLVLMVIPAAFLGMFCSFLGPIGNTILLCALLAAKLAVDILFFIFERLFDREVEQAREGGRQLPP